MQGLNEYEQKLLAGWEEVYKRTQLTLWILLALKQEAHHMAAIKQTIAKLTSGQIAADDKSMYRALRRFNDGGLVQYRLEPSQGGPDLKVYSLTDSGRAVLEEFIRRNIEATFFNPTVRKLIRKG